MVELKKTITLVEKVYDYENKEIATMQVNLQGDGSTPEIGVFGNGLSGIIGYNDDGTAIIDHTIDEIIEKAKPKFMAKAIKEQKKLCVENGVDPDLVNMIGLEKKENNE